MRRFRSRTVAVLTVLVVALPLLVALSRPAGADDATASTIDTSVRASTGWWWYYGITGSQLATELTAHHARLTQLKVEDASVPTFSATMVSNTGPYASAWWWYYGVDGATVSNTLTANHARLISVDPYETSSGLRFAVIEVPNTGSQARAWQWWYNETAAGVNSVVSNGNWRLVALEPYTVGSTVYYAVIQVANTGYDAKGWYYEIGASIATIDNVINQGFRVVSFSVDPSGGFDAIFVVSEGEGWDFWYGQSPSGIAAHVTADHTRLIDIDPYLVNGTRYWATVELDNTDPLQAPINAASRTVDNWAAANGWGAGVHAEYFAKVNRTGLAAPTIAANSSFRFEPASAIKILYAVYAMHQVQLRHDSLGSTVTYYVDPFDPNNPGVCPNPAWAVPANARNITLAKALQQMLDISDNRVTRAMAVRYGVANVNAYARSIGLTSTNIGQPFIGCGFNGGVRNDFTLADAAKVYAGISDGSLVSGVYRTDLLSYMLGGVPSASSEWGQMVSQQAARLGATSYAASFLAHMKEHEKGGSYVICDYTCATYHIYLTDAGSVWIPFKVSGRIVQVPYAFGGFVNDMSIPCSPGSGCSQENGAWYVLGQIGAQDAATTIYAALRSWLPVRK